jgi:hypothetical protein
MGQEYRLETLIETGTFRGDMVEAQRSHFRRIITIELADALWAAARDRFADAPHVTVLHGDSGEKLAEAIRLAEGPVLYWLDGHYSGGDTALGASETPIMREISLIAARGDKHDVIMIDDARLFGWRRGYPRLAVIRKFVSEYWPEHSLTIHSDIIQIAPRR